MNIFDRIKQLKLIEPDSATAARSKHDIMATLPMMTPIRQMSVRQILMRVFEVSVAGGLAAVFLFLITGGVANSPLAPAPFTAVNPQALHAEAQAIDIQIKLAGLAYEASRTTGTGTTGATAAPMAKSMMIAPTTAATTTSTSSEQATTSLSVDDALEALSK